MALANWIPQLVERIGSETDPAQSRVSAPVFAELVRLLSARTISRDAGRQVLSVLVAEGGEPAAIVEREGLAAMSGEDSGLADIVAAAIAADPDAAERVRGGNDKAIGPLVGYVMRETKGRADGGEVTRLIREKAPERHPTIIRRAFAGLVVVVGALLIFHFIAGLVMAVFYVVATVAVIVAVLWALKTMFW